VVRLIDATLTDSTAGQEAAHRLAWGPSGGAPEHRLSISPSPCGRRSRPLWLTICTWRARRRALRRHGQP
jgi:hypothetical protein